MIPALAAPAKNIKFVAGATNTSGIRAKLNAGRCTFLKTGQALHFSNFQKDAAATLPLDVTKFKAICEQLAIGP